MSEPVIFNAYFPDGGFDSNNVKFRAVVWAGSLALLWLAILANFINREDLLSGGTIHVLCSVSWVQPALSSLCSGLLFSSLCSTTL